MSQGPTVILNPAAGGGRAGARWPEWEARLLARLPGARVTRTGGSFDAARLATEAAEAGAPLVIAAGGDGTVNEVVNGLMASSAARRGDCVLGLLPLGTGSDLARGLGLPQDPAGGVELLTSGTPRSLDVGRIRCAGLGADGAAVHRHFVNEADFGIGAEVTRRINARVRRGGRATYLWTTVRALLAWRDPEVELRVDGGAPERLRIKSVFLANAPFAGGGMCIAPGARADDGRLRLVIFGALGRLEAIRRLGETYHGGEIEHPLIRYADCREVAADAREVVMIECDGEPVGRLPARLDLLPRALRVLMP